MKPEEVRHKIKTLSFHKGKAEITYYAVCGYTKLIHRHKAFANFTSVWWKTSCEDCVELSPNTPNKFIL